MDAIFQEQGHGIRIKQPSKARVCRGGKDAGLTAHEMDVFQAILRAHPGAIPASDIYKRLYPQKFGPTPSIMRVWISRLRKKLKPLGIDIITEHGGGFYRIETKGQGK